MLWGLTDVGTTDDQLVSVVIDDNMTKVHYGSMNEEPTTTPISDDDTEPATKGFVRSEINAVKDELLEHITQTTDKVMDHIAENNAKIMDHFDVVAENIHKDVAGANQDEITLIKDQQLPDHEKRIQALERRAGLPTGSPFQ